MAIPYKIAVLAYVFNSQGELLLLHRIKAPNKDLYSPIGGKLEQALGESPYACALREIEEEIQVHLELPDIRLMGMVSERAYQGETHWLMFCFEVLRPLDFAARTMNEGRLEWTPLARICELPIPQTDSEVIWPLIQQHSRMLRGPKAHESFSVHIDCRDAMRVTQEYPLGD